jgi:hypothetical protein
MKYSETSLNRPALGSKYLADLEGKFICKEFLIVEQGLKKSADIQGGRVF